MYFCDMLNAQLVADESGQRSMWNENEEKTMVQLSGNVFEKKKTLIECNTCEDYKLPYKWTSLFIPSFLSQTSESL